MIHFATSNNLSITFKSFLVDKMSAKGEYFQFTLRGKKYILSYNNNTYIVFQGFPTVLRALYVNSLVHFTVF